MASETHLSSCHVRADVIRQVHERGNEDVTELLMLFKEEEWKCQAAESLHAPEGHHG
jgi:hypothetical protein